MTNSEKPPLPPSAPPDRPASRSLTLAPALEFGADQRWTTYWDVERLCRGPAPVPAWVVTDHGAVDTDLGTLKTGKEADVVLLHRGVPGRGRGRFGQGGDGVVMAAKRYRDEDRRSFHRSAAYTEGRRVRRSRDTRALARKSAYGRLLAAGQWAMAEWDALCRLYEAGLPVPYPVQVDGTELLLELVTHEGLPAPRLVGTRPAPSLLADYYDQLREVLVALARLGLVHGDLSAYNVLAAGDRLVVIDLPQVVDLVGNPHGPDLLLRDCHNVVQWFRRRGLPVDEQELFAEVVAQAY